MHQPTRMWAAQAPRQLAALFMMALVVSAGLSSASAAPNDGERVYDRQLMRLAEILGAVHYLRELCNGTDGQRWRSAVDDLVRSEGTTALRRATIAKRFNLGYRSYRRAYRRCTPSARSTIDRFFKEAIKISEDLAKLGRN